MDTFKIGDRATFFKTFGAYMAEGQEVELVYHHGMCAGSNYGGFKFVNKDGGVHSLSGRLSGEWKYCGLYIPYDCVQLTGLEND